MNVKSYDHPNGPLRGPHVSTFECDSRVCGPTLEPVSVFRNRAEVARFCIPQLSWGDAIYVPAEWLIIQTLS
jgi:hypothetical protein